MYIIINYDKNKQHVERSLGIQCMVYRYVMSFFINEPVHVISNNLVF